MKKKELLFLLALFVFVSADAEIDLATNLQYSVSGDAVTITGYNGTVPENYSLVIPSQIEGKNVTTIAGSAFAAQSHSSCINITSIELPQTLTSIGDLAFQGVKCSTITFPSGITSLPHGVIANNSNLKEICFEGNITSLGSWCFSEDNNVERLVFYANTTPPTVGGGSFYLFNTSLCKVYVPKGYSSNWGSTWSGFEVIEGTLLKDAEGYYLLKTKRDWIDFAALVLEEPEANARMIADIDLGDDQTKIGDDIAYTNPSTSYASNPYKGTFDGQGHKLTVNYTTETGKFPSPFPNIQNATIRNLHVAGTIVSTTAHAGGVVSASWGTDVLENVWVSATISSTGQSWDECGAIVACMKKGTLTIKDCIFTGSMTSTRSYNGCFVGYCNAGTTTIDNCLSTGTFSYGGANIKYGNITHTNCYVYQFPSTIPSDMQVTDDDISDGTTATALQADREEEIWVQDLVLGIPMLKIFANNQDEDGYYLIGSVQDWNDFAELVNSGTDPAANARMIRDVEISTTIGIREDKPFSGTFDGNGHVLTANITSTATGINGNDVGVAPFHFIKNATIKNLKVDGIINSSSIHSSGLVGVAYGTNLVVGCVVSAKIKTSAQYVGGIIAHGYDSNTTVKDCLFNGIIEGGTRIGVIWGHNHGGTGNIINCLEIGSYTNSSYVNPIYRSEGGTINCSNNYYITGNDSKNNKATDDEISDGTTAAALQADREEEIWVQDPVLGIPMLKIFANEETEQPSEALNGVFTINASGEKVSFAKGNLQKIGSTYQFAEHQYDYFGTDQSDTHRDMYAFLDYSNPDNGESWSMLSNDEWGYLFATRSVTNTLSDGARYTMATLGGTYKGLIIFPDYYTHPEGTDFTPGVFNSNSNYTAQVSLEGWAMMEAAGCVFLPAAGYCSRGSTWSGVGNEVCYMSTTPDGSNNYYDPYFTPNSVNLYASSSQRTWSSIRLVMRLQPLTYTVPASGVGTFSSEVNIHLPEGLNAHYCKTYYEERSAISVVNISSGVVPANTGVLLSGTPGETFNLYPTPETADELEGNALVAVTKPVHINPTKGDYTNFMMKGGKFVKIADESYNVKMPANRAYLPLLSSVVAGANSISIVWDESNATAIEKPAATEISAESRIYNLNGQKLLAPQKGINIINGRKVIVK